MALEDSALRRTERENQESLAEKNRKAGVEAPSPQPTMSEILQAESQPFGEYVQSIATSTSDPRVLDIAERLMKGGAHQPHDIETMVNFRKGYLERKAVGESVVSTMNVYGEEMIRESGKLRGVAESVGQARFLALVNQGLQELAIKNPEAAKRIQTFYKSLNDFEKKVDAPLTAKLNTYCEKYGLDDVEVREALRAKNYGKRRAGLRELLRRDMSGGKRFGDSILSTLSFRQLGTAGKAKEVAGNNLTALIKRRDNLLKTSGNYLHMLAMSARPEIREALRNAMSNTEPAFKEGFQTKMTFEQAREKKDLPKSVEKPAVEARAREFAKKHAKVLKRPGPDADKLRSEFYQIERERVAELENMKRKQGLWASILLAVFSPFVDPRNPAATDPGIDRILHK